MKFLVLLSMQIKEIQIVTFNTPYPPNYGGVIDVFYKIKALHHLGVRVHLHTFYDDRQNTTVLEKYCKQVYLYKRHKGINRHLSYIPFGIFSRTSETLVKRLQENKCPILFESSKSIYPLYKTNFKQFTAIRCQNIEHLYTYGLFKSERHWVKKLAFRWEAFKLKYSESQYEKVNLLLSISQHEQRYFKKYFKTPSYLLPVFHGNSEITSKSGFGSYALYHGDLSIADNIKSALFIISVFKTLKHQLVIASSVFPKQIQKEISNEDHITFERIKTDAQLDSLIHNAHVNTLYSFQQSGTKLKVFNVLFKGRHCVLNTNMVDDQAILNACSVVSDKRSYQKVVEYLFRQPFEITKKRESALLKYNDVNNAKYLIDKFSEY